MEVFLYLGHGKVFLQCSMGLEKILFIPIVLVGRVSTYSSLLIEVLRFCICTTSSPVDRDAHYDQQLFIMWMETSEVSISAPCLIYRSPLANVVCQKKQKKKKTNHCLCFKNTLPALAFMFYYCKERVLV